MWLHIYIRAWDKHPEIGDRLQSVPNVGSSHWSVIRWNTFWYEISCDNLL